MVNTAYRKTSLHRDRPNLEPAVQRARSYGIDIAHAVQAQRCATRCPRMTRTSVRRLGHIPSSRCQENRRMEPAERGLFDDWTFLALAVWWSQTGSNRRPPACKAGALPTELWPRLDLTATLQAISRDPASQGLVGLERFELSTSRLSSARSNQLSYRPGKRGGRPNEERETKAAVSRRHFAGPV